MITITSTAESLEQAKALLEAGVDRLYIGEKNYGLRVPTALTNEEIQKITELAHDAGKTVTVAVNALMHTEMMAKIKDFLDFLVEIKADLIAEISPCASANRYRLRLPSAGQRRDVHLSPLAFLSDSAARLPCSMYPAATAKIACVLALNPLPSRWPAREFALTLSYTERQRAALLTLDN